MSRLSMILGMRSTPANHLRGTIHTGTITASFVAGEANTATSTTTTTASAAAIVRGWSMIDSFTLRAWAWVKATVLVRFQLLSIPELHVRVLVHLVPVVLVREVYALRFREVRTDESIFSLITAGPVLERAIVLRYDGLC